MREFSRPLFLEPDCAGFFAIWELIVQVGPKYIRKFFGFS